MSTAAGGAPSPDQTPAGWSDHAEPYDEWLAPLTRRFAADVVDALAVGQGTRLLDVAAGTGALALAAAAAGAEVLATDFAPGMIGLLERRAEALGLAVTTAVMDGQALDLPDGAFDAAASLFGLIFFPDTAAGARELHRVLRPGGRAAVAAWADGGLTFHPLVLEALAQAGVAEPGRAAAPAAFRLSAPAALGALLEEAGFADVAVRELEHAWPAPDPEALFRSAPSWSAPLRPVFRGLGPEQVAAGAAAFRDIVAQRFGGALPARALLATGSR
jgi:SAM-dependent methyltransferase